MTAAFRVDLAPLTIGANQNVGGQADGDLCGLGHGALLWYDSSRTAVVPRAYSVNPVTLAFARIGRQRGQSQPNVPAVTSE